MLAQFYPPIVGGEEHAVRSLSVQLVRRGHEVAVASILHDGLPEFEDDEGVRVHRVRSGSSRIPRLYAGSRRHAPPLADPELTWNLRRVMRSEGPDLVHAHNWIVHSFLPLKRRSGVPLVLSLHDYSLVCATKRLMLNGTTCDGPGPRKCLAHAHAHYGSTAGSGIALSLALGLRLQSALVDLFLPVSHAVARHLALQSRGLPYRVIPNFVSEQLGAASVPAEVALPAEGFVLFVGDLSFDKGVHVLIDAFAGLEEQVALVMIGRRVEPLDDGRLPRGAHIVEALGHDGVLNAFKRCGIAVVPSVWPEPSGLVALEAMAMGKPVIAARAGGLGETVVDGVTGLLVEPGDVAALRHAIEHLLADRDLRRRQGDAGRQRIDSEFGASVVVPKFELAYESVLSNGETAR